MKRFSLLGQNSTKSCHKDFKFFLLITCTVSDVVRGHAINSQPGRQPSLVFMSSQDKQDKLPCGPDPGLRSSRGPFLRPERSASPPPGCPP